MSVDGREAPECVADCTEVMASIDDSEDGKQFIIADVSTDDAWMRTRLAGIGTVSLGDYR